MQAVPFDYSAALTEPPTSNQVRLDAAFPYTGATKVWVRNITTDGTDVHLVLLAIAVGSTIYLQDKNDHTLFAMLDTTGAPVDKVDYVELPVQWLGNGGALLNNQAVVFAAVAPTVTPVPPTSGGGGAWLAVPMAGLHAISIVEDPPATEPIDLTTAKLYARLTGADLDPLFVTFIKAAREKLELDVGQALLTQTRRIWFDVVPEGVITLPPCCGPLQTVNEVAYIDGANVGHVLDPSSYQVDAASEPPRLALLGGIPYGATRAFQPLTMQIVAGYTDAAEIPGPLVHACGLLTGFYANASGDRFLADVLWDQYEETIAPFRLVTI
jgi:uncharacterized phiE125 gp8 family phage protein